MSIEDLKIAKDRLKKHFLTISIVKNSEVIFESSGKGISDLVKAIENFGSRLKGASVADKIVGKAAALLCVYAGFKAVYAHTLSVKAKTVFENQNVYFEWDILVEKIEECPFEKIAESISSPAEAYGKFKAWIEYNPC